MVAVAGMFGVYPRVPANTRFRGTVTRTCTPSLSRTVSPCRRASRAVRKSTAERAPAARAGGTAETVIATALPGRATSCRGRTVSHGRAEPRATTSIVTTAPRLATEIRREPAPTNAMRAGDAETAGAAAAITAPLP
jgi:hypothetical protein